MVPTLCRMTFADKLQRICDERGWNQAEIVRRLHPRVGKNTVSRWFSGAIRPYDEKVLLPLVEILRADLQWLLDDHMDEPPRPLSERERTILRLASRLGWDEAERRLLAAPLHPPGQLVRGEDSDEIPPLPPGAATGQDLSGLREELPGEIKRERAKREAEQAKQKAAREAEESRRKLSERGKGPKKP